MTCNIYEDPNLTLNARYSKEVGDDGRVERLVDIYESSDPWTDHRVALSAQAGGAQRHPSAVRRNTCRPAALVLGLLCLLLVVGVTVLSKLYISVLLEKDELSKTSHDNLIDGDCQTGGQTERNTTEWKRSKYSCYYKSTEMKNWTESRRDCQSRGADLVIIDNREEQEFVSDLIKHGASWIGLQAVENQRSWKWEWKWVDGKQPIYQPWQGGVSVTPRDGLTAYTHLHGQWSYSNNGSKQWICEKERVSW